MNNGYGVFGHVPDDASHGGGDSDYEDDNAAWGNGLRRRNPWKSANADGDESMLPDDGDFVGVDDDGNDDMTFGSTDHSVRRMRLFLIASHVGRVVPCGSMMRMRLTA